MVKLLLYLFLILAVSAPLAAQTDPLPSRPTAPLLSRDDTVRAINHLFERRRASGKRWLYFSTIGVLGVVRVLANPNTTTVNGYQTKSEVDGGAAATFGLVFFGLPAAVGVTKLVRFSENREDRIITAYTNSKILPRAVSRHLRRKDFVRALF